MFLLRPLIDAWSDPLFVPEGELSFGWYWRTDAEPAIGVQPWVLPRKSQSALTELTTGVFVAVGVLVGVPVDVLVGDGVLVAVGVLVGGTGVFVAVAVGVLVGSGVAV